MKKLSLIVLLSIPFLSFAQQIQWASKVLKYSNDLGGKINGIKRILGKPDAFPQGGPSANAWVSKDALGSAYVEVEFENSQTVKQIAIFENLNAGCATRVQVGDGSGKFRTVGRKKVDYRQGAYGYRQKSNADRLYYFNRKRRKIEQAPDVAHNADIDYFILENPETNVKAVRVDFNFALKPGQKQVDAIGISDSEEPILAQLKLLMGTENLAEAQQVVYAENENTRLSALTIINNELYYAVGNGDGTNEVHVTNLQNPKESLDITKKIRNNRNLNFVLGYTPSTQTILMGSEDKYRMGSQTLGFDFFNFVDGAYSYKEPLKITAYNNYGEYADAFLALDGQRILFGIESDLTQGGYDIYFTQPKGDGTYSYLQNLGKNLNSAGDETTPILLADNKTLIFASNGYSGYGDFDLYVTTRLDDTWKNWSEPKNLGPKINGQSFEVSPAYDEKTESLYFVAFKNGISTIQKVALPLSLLKN